MTKTYCLYGLIAGFCLIEGGPVRAQGGPPAQNVNVVNTPTVTVAGTPTVAIAGTPMVAVAGIAVSTVKIFDESDFQVSNPISVGAFKQIRIAADCSDPSQSPIVRPFVLLGNNINEVAAMGDLLAPCNSGASATYDVPGEAVVINVVNGPARVVIFGRAN
jgi:hypothetical protein